MIHRLSYTMYGTRGNDVATLKIGCRSYSVSEQINCPE